MSNPDTNGSLSDIWQRFIDGEENDFKFLGLHDSTPSEELNSCISQHLATLVEKSNRDFLVPQSDDAAGIKSYLVRIIGSRKDLSKDNLDYILFNAIRPTVIAYALSNESISAQTIFNSDFIERIETEFKTDSGVVRSYHHTLSIKTNFFKEEITNRLNEGFRNLSLEWKIRILGIKLHCSECLSILDRDFNIW